MENHSEITLRRVIEEVDGFAPVKIIFNGVVLYNDYDSEAGEGCNPLSIVADRIWQFDNYVATSVTIEIVEFHHSIIKIQGEYVAKFDEE